MKERKLPQNGFGNRSGGGGGEHQGGGKSSSELVQERVLNIIAARGKTKRLVFKNKGGHRECKGRQKRALIKRTLTCATGVLTAHAARKGADQREKEKGML